MPKKQDTNTKYLSMKINSEEIFILKKVVKQYLLEQECLAYKDTRTIDAYPIYERLKHIIALYELKNPSDLGK